MRPAGSRGPYRPLELREKLYRRVLELRGMGLSYRQIQMKILEEEGEFLRKSTISCWARRIHTPHGDGLGRPLEDQRVRRLRPCPELAYVIGSGLGDGYVKFVKESYRYLAVLAVKDYDYAAEFGRCAAVALGRSEPYRPRWDKDLRRWVVVFDSKELYDLLRKPIDIERIRPFVEHCDKCMAAFIRGFADAEGSVCKDKENLGHILIANTDLELLSYVQRLLEKLGIHSKIYPRRKEKFFVINGKKYRRRKTVIYTLKIYRKGDKMRFRELVNFAIARKGRVLELLK
ncbi:MAG: hypothetical protein NZ918_04760 [Aigarchaeota archaeon]|nr:hypothetical protein [Aigarchaeota archaeon]